MANIYYSDNLAAERLKRCYDIAPPRVRQYLQAELDFVLDRVRPGDVILDLGRGYGGADLESRLRRILFSTCPKAARSTSGALRTRHYSRRIFPQENGVQARRGGGLGRS